ncbi:MAG: PQQ-dependent sugar dehydrogenase [Tepidiformaceae bacterium]
MKRWIAILFALSTFAFAAFAVAACGGDDDTGATATVQGGSATALASATVSQTPGGTNGVVSLGLEQVAGGFTRPTFVTNAGDGSGRLFVVEKPGVISIIKNGKKLDKPFLDLTSVVGSSGNEQGLLGLAFHPGFSQNGRFFVAYTAKNADNTVAEYHVKTTGSDLADAGSGKTLFAVPDKYPNHNGGMLAFGPDGYLYISMGDGGSGGDPDGNGQNLGTLLGKLLRIDVDGGDPYGIPPTNPFAKIAGARSEVWSYGLRNPWRFSFDRQTGDIWIGDVGQNKYEEIDFQAAADKGGANYGWNIMEGLHCFQPPSGCNQDGLVKPVFEYSHDSGGCSVTGGYVYRGAAIPSVRGAYLFTDYCSAKLWATRQEGGTFTTTEIGELPEGVSGFGEDEAGELYITLDQAGTVNRIIAK